MKDIIAIIIQYEHTAKNIIKAINKTYGKNFIEDTLLDHKIEKKKRHPHLKVINYYNLKLTEYPEKTKKQIRIITGLYFNISEKSVQYHITKSKS